MYLFAKEVRGSNSSGGSNPPVSAVNISYRETERSQIMDNFIKKIKSGTATVLGSGTFITFNEDPVEIDFGVVQGGTGPLKVIFEFTKDKDSEGPVLKSEVVETNKILKLILINFDNDFGSGTIKPLEIGTYENQKLFIGFRVHTMANGESKTLHYTFYKNG
jgi:hypothetical protein